MTHADLAKAMAAVVKDYVRAERAPLETRIAVLEALTSPLHKSLNSLLSEGAAVRERVAILESRPPLQGLQGDRGADGLPGRDGRDGVPGLPGDKGADGLHGKDGADGLGFEDLDVVLEGDRTLVFRFANGTREKTFRVDVGWPVYQQRWVQGKAYVPGDLVTWDGHLWHCQEATDDGQPGVSKAWMQSVTRGRAGKDGRDGKDWAPLPVVHVGGAK